MASMSPGSRLDVGTAVLAAARAVDTSLIKQRLDKFGQVHGAYTEAQGQVDAAETQLRAYQAKVGLHDAEQDEAVELLARALVADGHPRTNPFASFGGPSPTALMRMSGPDQAKALQQLSAALQRNKHISKATLQAAQAAEKASRTVAEAAVPADGLEQAVREARHTRDAIGQTWETALAALKRGARAAADDGAPDLYATLFGTTAKKPRRAKATPPEAATPPQTEAKSA